MNMIFKGKGMKNLRRHIFMTAAPQLTAVDINQMTCFVMIYLPADRLTGGRLVVTVANTPRGRGLQIKKKIKLFLGGGGVHLFVFTAIIAEMTKFCCFCSVFPLSFRPLQVPLDIAGVNGSCGDCGVSGSSSPTFLSCLILSQLTPPYFCNSYLK